MISSRFQILTLSIVLLMVSISSGKNCSKFEWNCKSGECVDMDVLCDGATDCRDGSDETYDLCGQFVCPSFAFRCAYGGCISAAAKCDNVQDCADNSDESTELCSINVLK